VTANGQTVAQGTAKSEDQTFPLTRALKAGETVRGKQDFATEGSDWTPDGNARMSISKTSLGDSLQAQQTACGIPGPITQLPDPDPLPADHFRVAPPKVSGPLFACQFQVDIGKVFDGATVKIPRTSGEEFACFDRSSLRLNLVAPLKQGEKIQASQNFPACEIVSDLSNPPVPVGPLSLPPPFLFGPICNRDRIVRVAGLIPKAQVMFVRSDGSDFAYGTAWDSTCDFPMPDLFSVTSLRVKQGLCIPLQWSDLSNEVKIDQQPTLGDLFLKLVAPLVEVRPAGPRSRAVLRASPCT